MMDDGNEVIVGEEAKGSRGTWLEGMRRSVVESREEEGGAELGCGKGTVSPILIGFHILW